MLDDFCMTTKDKDVGERLRVLRQAHKLGIKTVAKKVSVDYTYLSKIENGNRPVNAELVSKLCDLYGVDPEEILARIGTLPPDIADIFEAHGKEVFELLRSRYGKVGSPADGSE